MGFFFKLWGDESCSFLDPTPWETGKNTMSQVPLSELGWTKSSYPKCEFWVAFYTYTYIYMYIKNVCLAMYVTNLCISVLKSGSLIESHLPLIFLAFSRTQQSFFTGWGLFLLLFLDSAWEESWDLQKTGRSLSKIFPVKKKKLLLWIKAGGTPLNYAISLLVIN